MKCVHKNCKQDPCYDDAAWHMQLSKKSDIDKPICTSVECYCGKHNKPSQAKGE